MGFEEESEMAHDQIRAEIFAWLEENFMNAICDIHQQQWGVPCGPTLEMIKEDSMKQPIKLTWRNRRDLIIIENCLLVSEDTPIFDSKTGRPVTGVMEKMAELDLVLFEDEAGLFTLRTNQVINIEILK